MEPNLIEVIIIGIKSWLMLALAIGILFVSIVVLNKFTSKKKDGKKGE